MTATAIIVEPYLSGGLLPSALQRFGVKSLGVHLRPQVGKVAETFLDAEYPDHIIYEGSIDVLRRQIGETDVIAVMAGQEAGVELADRIAEAYGVVGNVSDLSAARRDKYLMHKTIAAAGLRSIRQCRSDTLSELVAWAEAADCWPVVIKPVNSGGTDGVRFCSNPAAIEAAFANAIGQTNLLGFANREMLVQERISGTEYIVDTVSCQGVHHIVNIARYEKEVCDDGAPIYRAIHFIDPTEWLKHRAMTDYVLAVLDALGIVTGPSHSEVFATATGPVLVETGARLCGAMVPRYLDEISTRSILDLTVMAYLSPYDFSVAVAQPLFHSKKLCAFVMRTRQSGRLVSRPGAELVRSLKGYRDVQWYGEIGGAIVPTCDLMTGLGMIFLMADDAHSINQDLSTLKTWEDSDSLVLVE